jgi:hypothetical protein
MSIVNPAPQPQLIAAQAAVCNAPGGKFFVKLMIRQYKVKDLITLLCKDTNTFLNKVIEVMKGSSQVPSQLREYVETNREKYIQAINEIKVKYKLDVSCSRIGFIQTEEGFSKLFDAIFNLFCVLPFGPMITKNNSQKVLKATMNINKVFGEGRNNSRLIKFPVQNMKLQSLGATTGGKHKTRRKYKKLRKTRKNRRV